MVAPFLTGLGILPFVGYSSPIQQLFNTHLPKLNPTQHHKNVSPVEMQLFYGATILTFLGGAHWGFASTSYNTKSTIVNSARFTYGVLPSLIAWPLLSMAKTNQNLTIDGLSCGLLGAFVVDTNLLRASLIPRSFFRVRLIPTVFGVLSMQSNHSRCSSK